MELRKFSAGTVEKQGNILIIRYEKSTDITLEDMKEITAIRKALFKKNQYASLIDMRSDKVNLTKEAKAYATENKTIKKLRVAEVLLVSSFIQRIGIHSYIKIFRSGDNITVMTNEENALHWLNKQFDKKAITATE